MICLNCGKEYKYTHHNDGTYVHYCSLKCREDGERCKKQEKDGPKLLVCQHCGKEYIWENKGNWNKNNEQVLPHGKSSSNEVVNSKKYCCYECGKTHRKEKVCATNLKLYGNEVAIKSDIIKARLKKSLSEISPERKQEAVKKRIETCKQKKEQISANLSKAVRKAFEERGDIIAEKRKKTCLKKYGVEHTTQLESTKQKAKKTCLERYGFEYAMQSKEIHKRAEQTNLIRYGDKVASRNKVVRNKIQESNLNKSEEERRAISDKYKATCLERFGVECSLLAEEVKKKGRETNLKQKDKLAERYRRQWENNLKKYGVEYTCLLDSAQRFSGCISKINKSFMKKLDKVGINYEFEFKLVRYSYDIKIGNILVEINPMFTHNSSVGGRDSRISPKPVDYHFQKSLIAKQNGYRCIHIWDWDNQDKIVNSLKPSVEVKAYSFSICEPSFEEVSEFLHEYTLGEILYDQIALSVGLCDEKGTLIQLMSFGKMAGEDSYQLFEVCTKFGYSVIDGPKELFNFFLSKYNPDFIVSYCDNAKFDDSLYTAIGMCLSNYGKPIAHWFNIKTKHHVVEDELTEDIDDKFMVDAGYLKLYDCGRSTFVWHKENSKDGKI